MIAAERRASAGSFAPTAGSFAVTLALCLLVTIAGFWIPLTHWHYTTGNDWDLFSGYSLVLRTSLLRFHRFPIHDPWVGGGLDLLANPQTRLFSPFLLADLLFHPYVADLVTLLLYGFAGVVGMFLVLRERGVSRATALAGAALFIHSSWFGLHYTEGHIAYGSMQLFPWVYYFGRKLGKPYAFFGLTSLMTLFVLDGGIYTAIFSLMLLLASAAVGLIRPAVLFRGDWKVQLLNALSLASALLMISIKVLPVVSLTAGLEPVIDFMPLSFSELLPILFNPAQRHLDIASVSSLWRFHEFGCYISPLGIAIVLYQCRSREFFWKRLQYIIPILIFFWIGSGWGGQFNPWHIYQRIPLLNIAHIQSRLFVLMDFFFALLVAEALDAFRPRPTRWLWVSLLSILVAEAVFVKNYPFYFGYQFEKPVPAGQFIPDAKIQGVKCDGTKPDLYLRGDFCFVHAYETAAPKTKVLNDEDLGYRGLVYVQSGAGQVKLDSYTPGRFELSYSAAGPVRAEIDSNYLAGWAVESGSARVHRNANGLIGLDLDAGTGHAVLVYRPSYLKYTLPAYCLGVLIWLGLAFGFLRRVKRFG